MSFLHAMRSHNWLCYIESALYWSVGWRGSAPVLFDRGQPWPKNHVLHLYSMFVIISGWRYTLSLWQLGWVRWAVQEQQRVWLYPSTQHGSRQDYTGDYHLMFVLGIKVILLLQWSYMFEVKYPGLTTRETYQCNNGYVLHVNSPVIWFLIHKIRAASSTVNFWWICISTFLADLIHRHIPPVHTGQDSAGHRTGEYAAELATRVWYVATHGRQWDH